MSLRVRPAIHLRIHRAGRKPIDAVLMFKTLVLSALYNLSE